MLLKLFLHAQAPLFSHQKWYRVEDGLPQSFVVDIHQDETGFIWLATRDGLARFDGRSFKTWKNDPNDTTTLAGNVVQEMFRLENGRFIIFFQGNIVDELDPVTGKVRHLTSDPMIAGYFQKGRRFLFPKSNQWFYHYEKEKGIGIIDLVHPEKNTFYNARNILQKEDSVVGSYLHPDGRLWMVTPTGIYRMDSSRTKVNWHPYGQRQEMTKPFRVRPAEVFLAWDEWLVISSIDALYFWNIHNHRLQKVDLVAPANTQYRFPGYFQTDAAGFLYFRRGPGVYRMDRSLQQPVLVWENQIVPGRSITGCLVDRTGTLWVGVDAAGLMKVNLKTMPLTSMPYKGTFHQTALELQGFSAAQLPDGWLDTRYGSYYFRYAYSPEGKLYVTYSFGVPVADRQLFVATNKTFKPLPMPPGPVLTYFRGITFDSSGSIYAYNENGNELYSWKNDETLPEITKLFPPDSIGMIDVADAKMLDDVLWMSTYGEGLLKIKKGKVVAHYSGRNGGRLKMPDNLTHINIDPVEKDIVWIGSLGGGLVKMSRTGGILDILTTKDGLPNNTVYCMENDHDGNIWLSTNNGLVRFSPSTRSMHVFYRSDGLPGNEFNRSHSMKLMDGRLAFGGPDGLVVFDPKNFEPISGKFDTRLTITDVEVNGKQLLEKLDTQLLKGPLANLKELELPYHQNYLGVSFAALLFNEPQKTKYRYRLLPDEKDWNETGNNAYARYTQLRPGRYILEMNATGLDGEWSGQIKKLEIVIHPPFWNTWYAWLFYAVVVAGLVRYAVTNRIKQLKAREQVAFEHREAQRLRELEKMK
ncbi:MAG: hypothetical protein MUE99_02350, partial [Chitinophagaceae bacterium]|nr:hypothetical protein [Chitinophagaceae bacterium]